MACTRTRPRSRRRVRPTRWALREAGYHTALLGKAHLYLDEQLTVSHMDDMAGRLEALGFAEVFETGDKFVGRSRPATRTTSPAAACSTPTKSTSPTAATRERTKTARTPPNACPCGTRHRHPSRWSPMSMPGTGSGPWSGSSATSARNRSSSSSASQGHMIPGEAPAEAVERYRGVDISMPASTRRPTIEGTGAMAPLELVPVGLGLRHDDRRRHPGHAALVRRRHLGHRPGRRRHGRGACSAGGSWTTPGSSTPATTVRWAAITG